MSRLILYDTCYCITVSSTLLEACNTAAFPSHVKYVMPVVILDRLDVRKSEHSVFWEMEKNNNIPAVPR